MEPKEKTGRGGTNITTQVLEDHAKEYDALKHAHLANIISTGASLSLRFYTMETTKIRAD